MLLQGCSVKSEKADKCVYENKGVHSEMSHEVAIGFFPICGKDHMTIKNYSSTKTYECEVSYKGHLRTFLFTPGSVVTFTLNQNSEDYDYGFNCEVYNKK
tara:strand:- start:417 stop:716 length:300 start_codon:yes stop_codon:yes gene_type:complete